MGQGGIPDQAAEQVQQVDRAGEVQAELSALYNVPQPHRAEGERSEIQWAQHLSPVQSVADKGRYEELATVMVGLQLGVAEYLVQAARIAGQQVKPRHPQPQAHVVHRLPVVS